MPDDADNARVRAAIRRLRHTSEHYKWLYAASQRSIAYLQKNNQQLRARLHKTRNMARQIQNLRRQVRVSQVVGVRNKLRERLRCRRQIRQLNQQHENAVDELVERFVLRTPLFSGS